MKDREAEIFDLALTQAIDKYMEMEPDEIYRAIVMDWHDQMASLLLSFFFGAADNSYSNRIRSIYAQKRRDFSEIMTFFYARVLDLPFIK
jgi:hypothetical protein